MAARKVWVVCGGPSTEYEVSLSSARLVCDEISLTGQQVRPVLITRQGRWLIEDRYMTEDKDRKWATGFLEDAATINQPLVGMDLGEALSRMMHEKLDCVFMALHGQYGEDGRMQGFFETASIAYTGSGVLASALAFNKATSIETFRAAGLTTARSIRFCRGRDSSSLRSLNLPLFVKPLRGGSSVGMTYVRTPSELEQAIELALQSDTEALVEERVEGVEVTCGVLDQVKDGQYVPTPLLPTEIRPKTAEFFDYTAKYTAGMSHEITPAELPERTISRIQEVALAAHIALGCEGASRSDMIVPPGEHAQPVILETNTLPGLTRTSLLPQQAVACGLTLPQLFDTLIDHGIDRKKRCGTN